MSDDDKSLQEPFYKARLPAKVNAEIHTQSDTKRCLQDDALC